MSSLSSTAMCSQVGPALRPQVDDDVEDCASRASHQLGLGCRRILKMHPPKRAFLQVRSDIGLGDDGLQPVLTELILAEGACEEASLVVPAFEVDDEGAFELGLGEYHIGLLGRKVSMPMPAFWSSRVAITRRPFRCADRLRAASSRRGAGLPARPGAHRR